MYYFFTLSNSLYMTPQSPFLDDKLYCLNFPSKWPPTFVTCHRNYQGQAILILKQIEQVGRKNVNCKQVLVFLINVSNGLWWPTNLGGN